MIITATTSAPSAGQSVELGLTPSPVYGLWTNINNALVAFARKRGGVGLGLNLVQSYADLHGAAIDLESVLDQGTTVTVTFPPERTVRD